MRYSAGSAVWSMIDEGDCLRVDCHSPSFGEAPYKVAFFDRDFISAPDNHIPLYKRIFKPGMENLSFVGFAQSTPTLFPFVESQSRLVAAHLIGEYALPSEAEMEQTIKDDEEKYIGHVLKTARHTQQVDYFIYEHDLRAREIPAGRTRAKARVGKVAS